MGLGEYLSKTFVFMVVLPMACIWVVEFFWNQSNTWSGKFESLFLAPILFVAVPLEYIKNQERDG